VEYVVIIFFCGLSAGIVAKYRGNSFLLWFAIGLVLPFVGTLAAALYRRDSEVEKKECPECGSPVAIHDQVCMNCGHDIEWVWDDPATPATG
jgi:DNA-directed RNA polymerase subunit RPC12/RpoP